MFTVPEFLRDLILVLIAVASASLIHHGWNILTESFKFKDKKTRQKIGVWVSITFILFMLVVLIVGGVEQNRKVIYAEEQRNSELIKTIDDIINKSNDKQTETIIEVIQQKEN